MKRAALAFLIYLCAQLGVVISFAAYCIATDVAPQAAEAIYASPSLLLAFSICQLVWLGGAILLLWRTKISGLWAPTAVPLSAETRTLPLALLAMIFFGLAVSAAIAPFGLSDGGTTEIFDAMKTSPIAILVLCIIGPLAEETVFRGGILGGLTGTRLSPMLSAVIASALFGVAHMNWFQGVSAFLMGLLLCCFYIRTGGLLTCVAAHVLNNSISVFFLFFPTLDFTESLQTLPAALGVAAAMLLLSIASLIGWHKWLSRAAIADIRKNREA